jgi:hypothetical protein
MFRKRFNELQIPPAATSDPNAVEIARIWAANNAQHVSLNVGLWDDPAAWGLMLADLARHAANYYHQVHGYPVDKVLARIKEGLDADWDDSTSTITGQIMGDDKPPIKQ